MGQIFAYHCEISAQVKLDLGASMVNVRVISLVPGAAEEGGIQWWPWVLSKYFWRTFAGLLGLK